MNVYPGKIAHKMISFASFLRRDPVGAFRRFQGYFKDPLFLYQMGKVGSSTHQNTLQSLYHVYHMHTEEEFRRKYEGVHKRIPSLIGRELDLITIAREPVGRKISTFFQNLVNSPYRFSFRSEQEALDAGMDELIGRFHEWQEGVEEATCWYDKHFQPATGVRIYNHEFDKDRGWIIIKSGRWRILVLRFSDIKTNHVLALNSFLMTRFGETARIDSLRSSNVTSKKWYASLMHEFRARIVFNTDELDRAYESKYMRYFHTDCDISEMRSVWRSK